MKKIIMMLAVTGAVNMVNAQQLQTTSFYDEQGLMHNPSVAGTGDKNFIAATYRTQWSGISGAPQTATVYGSFALPQYKAGVGGYLYNDVTGPTTRRGLNLDLAKHIPLSNGGQFSIGLAGRILQYSIDKTKISGSLGSDPVLAGGDNKIKFDADFGIVYAGKNLQLGASVSQLVQSKLQFYSGALTRTDEARLYRHYYFHGFYKWDVDGSTKLIPNFVLTYLPNAPTEFQAGVTVEHKNIFWWGLGLKVKQSFMASAGLIIRDKFRVGYTYDAYLTPLSGFDGGYNANEFLLRYEF